MRDFIINTVLVRENKTGKIFDLFYRTKLMGEEVTVRPISHQSMLINWFQFLQKSRVSEIGWLIATNLFYILQVSLNWAEAKTNALQRL